MSKRNGEGWYPIPVGIGEPIMYPSVTKVCQVLAKPYIVDWAAGQDVNWFRERASIGFLGDGFDQQDAENHERGLDKLAEQAKVYHKTISQSAMDYGSRIHNALDVYHKTGAYPVDPELRAAFEACVDEEQASGITTIESEFMVYNEIYRYAGTLDHHLHKGNMAEEGISDYKTYGGKKVVVYPEHLMQLAAYVYAHESMTGKILDFGDICYLSRETGLPTRKSFSRIQLINPFMRFVCLCQYFWLSQERKLK
jgi:hypothetical protein